MVIATVEHILLKEAVLSDDQEQLVNETAVPASPSSNLQHTKRERDVDKFIT